MKKVEPLKLSLQQIEEMTGESLPVIHDAINAGHLVTFLCGRRRYARPEAVKAWVDLFEKESNAGRPLCYRARTAERRVSIMAHTLAGNSPPVASATRRTHARTVSRPNRREVGA